MNTFIHIALKNLFLEVNWRSLFAWCFCLCIYVGLVYGNVYYILIYNILAANLDKLTQNPDMIKMNWSIIALEVTFALIAAVLSILSYETLKSIKHLVFGKPFWLSVFSLASFLCQMLEFFKSLLSNTNGW